MQNPTTVYLEGNNKLTRIPFMFVCLFVCLFTYFFFFGFLDLFFSRPYSPGCPGAHSVDQAGLELRNLPASASQVLELKACATTAQHLLTSFVYF